MKNVSITIMKLYRFAASVINSNFLRKTNFHKHEEGESEEETVLKTKVPHVYKNDHNEKTASLLDVPQTNLPVCINKTNEKGDSDGGGEEIQLSSKGLKRAEKMMA